MEATNIYGARLDHMNSSKNFYQSYTSTKMYVDSIEAIIKSLEKELKTLVDKSGPSSVRAITYDSIPGVAIKIPDEKVLHRIIELRAAIYINKANLMEWADTLDTIKRNITKKSKTLDDINLKVFVAAWIEGKKNEEIAAELGYSIGRIWNVKVQLNQILSSA